MYLQLQKEKRLKEKVFQTVTREETQETPKQEMQTITTTKTIDFNNLFKWIFIISTGIVLIPLYFCIAVTKNLK